jgi:cell division protein FtsI/penicillin-binding protein 2
MSSHPLEEGMLWWGLAFAMLMILFYLGFTLWIIAVVIHDKMEQRKEVRNARKRRAQKDNQG